MVIDVQKIQKGMILAEDIIHPRKGILMKKKQQISPEMIPLLTRFGISKIVIIDNQLIQNTEKANQIEHTTSDIRLQISQDLMSATLIINSSDNYHLTVEDIRNLLIQKNIIHGIDETLIGLTVTQWNTHKKQTEVKDIAKGTPAQAAKTDGYQITTPYISEVSLIENIRKFQYYWEVAGLLPDNIRGINVGTVIAEKINAQPLIPGKNILGQTIRTDQIISNKITPAEGAGYSEGGKFIIAKKSGFVFLNKNSIGILNISFDGSIDISISDDKMTARIISHEPGEGGYMPSEAQIKKMLSDRGIRFGINEYRISQLVQSFSSGQYPSNPIVIAEGRAAKDGENGTVKYLFDTETSLKPQLNPDGSVDYKKISIIKSVTKDQKLAQLIPPTSGINGVNLFGQNLPCNDGIAEKLPVGKNTIIDPQDPSFLIATTSGIIHLENSLIEITEGLIVSGHVDYSTGNINYAKSVIINGDVKSGFEVNCGGDLQIDGTIEDCKISLQGNLLCRLGFIGQGKGIIDAKGNVNISFTKNQIIKSKQNVNIAKESINCTIAAKNSITVHGKPLSAAGGLLMAGKSITLYSVGNHSGIKTMLDVGVDFTIKEELEKKEIFHQDLIASYAKLQEASQRYERMCTPNKPLPLKEQFLYTKISESISKYKLQIQIIEQQKEALKSRLYNLNDVFIRIEHSAMPGTLFKFADRIFLIKDQIIGPKTVRLINQEFKFI